jgi:cell division protein FtsB
MARRSVFEFRKIKKGNKGDFNVFGKAFLVLGILVVFGLLRNTYKAISAQKRLEEAREDLVEAQERKKELESELLGMSGELYVEKMARDGLGLSYEGEVVLVLPPEEEVKKFSPRRVERQEFSLPKSNWEKWWSMFF